MSIFRTAALAATILTLSAVQAFAHADLESSVPAANSTVSPTARIVLHFGEALEGRLSGADISSTSMMMGGNMSAHVMKIDGVTSALDPADHKTLVVTLKTLLAPGVYKVAWHAVSTDTHREQGTFSFTVH